MMEGTGKVTRKKSVDVNISAGLTPNRWPEQFQQDVTAFERFSKCDDESITR